MRRHLAIALLALGVSTVHAGPRIRVDRFPDALRLAFLDGDERAPVRQGYTGDASIDVGRVTATTTKCTPRSCIIKRRFRLRVEGRSRSRFATVRAFVNEATPGQRLRIDGKLLTPAPIVIEAAAPIGIATSHVLELEVASSEEEGLLAHTIEWTVEN